MGRRKRNKRKKSSKSDTEFEQRKLPKHGVRNSFRIPEVSDIIKHNNDVIYGDSNESFSSVYDTGHSVLDTSSSRTT